MKARWCHCWHRPESAETQGNQWGSFAPGEHQREHRINAGHSPARMIAVRLRNAKVGSSVLILPPATQGKTGRRDPFCFPTHTFTLSARPTNWVGQEKAARRRLALETGNRTYAATASTVSICTFDDHFDRADFATMRSCTSRSTILTRSIAWLMGVSPWVCDR